MFGTVQLTFLCHLEFGLHKQQKENDQKFDARATALAQTPPMPLRSLKQKKHKMPEEHFKTRGAAPATRRMGLSLTPGQRHAMLSAEKSRSKDSRLKRLVSKLKPEWPSSQIFDMIMCFESICLRTPSMIYSSHWMYWYVALCYIVLASCCESYISSHLPIPGYWAWPTL